MARRGGTSAAAARRKKRKSAQLIETRAKKEFTFRGKTLPELQALSVDDLLPLLSARARRSLGRGLTDEQQKLIDAVRITEQGSPVKTHRREMVILPEFVGHTFALHAGNGFLTFTVQPEMIGHFLGEFALTRRAVRHGGVGVGATRGSKHLPLK